MGFAVAGRTGPRGWLISGLHRLTHRQQNAGVWVGGLNHIADPGGPAGD